LQRADRAREAEYATLVEQAIQEYELHFARSPWNGFLASLSLGLLAARRSPVEATRLRRKGLEWIERFPAVPHLKAMEARQIAEAYTHLAKFQTGSRADALFTEAERALASVAPEPLGVFLLEHCAGVLFRWADQERNAESEAVFERARRKFEEAYRLDPTDKRKRLYPYAQALRRRAAALSGDRALELLAIARGAAEELLSENREDAAIWVLLGFAAALEAEKRSGQQRDWMDEADRCFREAMKWRAGKVGGILVDWALSLGRFAMSKSGPEALEFYARADEKLREAEKIVPEPLALRLNWSAILLREARERGGPPELWERAKHQAEKAEAIDRGFGAYNLACIASNLDDRQNVEAWLTVSADHGHILPLSEILRDVNFQSICSEPWFRKLLDRIFGCGL
jgi:hypothetical protein